MIEDSAEFPEKQVNERRSILVVEDEILVRMSVVEDLLQAGYLVLEAATAEEAIALLAGGVHIDLVFSDIQMPGALDGIALLHVVRKNLSSVPVILTSGHVKPPRDALGDDVTFVPKPYFARDLLDLVASMIESGRGVAAEAS